MHKFPDLPPIWTLAMIIVSWVLSRFLPLYRFDLPPVFPVILAIVGLCLILWSAVWFWRKKTTIEPHDTPTALIVEGPYRVSRNPIYLGMAVIVLAASLWFGALGAILPALAFPFIITARFIRNEEAALTNAFGDSASTYFAKTRRWLW